MDLIREFLTPEQHQKLFSWIDAYIFQYHTGQYRAFLLHVLSQEKNLLWLPKEDATDIFQYLGDVIGEFELPIQLRKIYLSEQEQEELKRRELLKKEEQENRELRQELREMRDAFSVIVAKTRKKAGQFQKIDIFLKNCRHKHALGQYIASYLRDYFSREPVYLYEPQDLEDLVSLLTFSGKKHFLKLVDEQHEDFEYLPCYSMLLDKDVYTHYLNINTMNEKNLCNAGCP